MAQKTVKLSQQYIVHQQVFDSVTLREPTLADIYIDGLGEPTEWQQSAAGVLVLLIRHEVIGEYIQRLAVNPTAECLTGLNPIDALRVGKAVRDFFTEAATPENAPTGSSSDTASTSNA